MNTRFGLLAKSLVASNSYALIPKIAVDRGICLPQYMASRFGGSGFGLNSHGDTFTTPRKGGMASAVARALQEKRCRLKLFSP